MPLTTATRPLISVVTPVYGCAACLCELHSRLVTVLKVISPNYQIVFVNDQSPDESWNVIKSLALQDERILGINLSRNFGQHTAITAGLDRAEGEWVVVMDCDLQDMPEEIPRLYAHAQAQKLDIVFGRREERQDSLLKRLSSRFFHATLTYLSGTKQDAATANFGIFHRRVILALSQMREPIRAFPIQVNWLGFRRGSVDIKHAVRTQGSSSYNLRRLINLALNIILAFSDKPLRLVVKLGLTISFISLCFTIYIIYRGLTGSYAVLGYPSLLASIWFLSGLLMFVLGIIGLYIGKTFEGVKNRPLYVIQSDTTDLTPEKRYAV